jgi:hypothetical protein
MKNLVSEAARSVKKWGRAALPGIYAYAGRPAQSSAFHIHQACIAQRDVENSICNFKCMLLFNLVYKNYRHFD